MGAGGSDQTQDGAWRGPGLELRQQELEQALTWNAPAACQQLLHQAGSRALGALEYHTNIPHMPAEQSLSSRSFPQ